MSAAQLLGLHIILLPVYKTLGKNAAQAGRESPVQTTHELADIGRVGEPVPSAPGAVPGQAYWQEHVLQAGVCGARGLLGLLHPKPVVLAFQRSMQETEGRSNAQTLCVST